MLNLRLDDLFSPTVIEAFQRQWRAEPEMATAQAIEAVRKIVSPDNDEERALARFVLGLVGPEPDGTAWLEALSVGSFKLRNNVTYAIGRKGETPAKFIDRQNQRIAQLANHPMARDRQSAHENAYRDALRLIVASSLLRQLQTSVAAKAAIGAGWPLMVAVSDHLSEREKRILFWFGNDAELHKELATTTQTTLQAFEDRRGGFDLPARLRYEGRTPPGVSVHKHFGSKADAELQLALSLKSRHMLTSFVPDFIKDAERDTLDQFGRPKAAYRARLLLGAYHLALGPGLGSEARSYVFALGYRAFCRKLAREAWLAGGEGQQPVDFAVQCAIWRHIEAGGFMPHDTPVEYLHYVEEDACYCFQTMKAAWAGYRSWEDAGFFRFEPDPTTYTDLDL